MLALVTVELVRALTGSDTLTTHATKAFRGFVTLVFVAYGASKIGQAQSFSQSIANYRILPQELVNVAAVTVPWVETLAGLALLRRKWLGGGLAVTAGMNVVFIAAITSALARGPRHQLRVLHAARGVPDVQQPLAGTGPERHPPRDGRLRVGERRAEAG